MATPTLALTFQDHIIRVAEFLGIVKYAADSDGNARKGVATVPTNEHDLDLCKRIVNDGWRRFYNSKPRWNWMRPRVSITFNPNGTTDGASEVIDGDDARYYMPDGFYGHVMGSFTYDGSGPLIGVRLSPSSDTHLRELYASNGTTTGIPTLVSFRPVTEKNDTRWEMYVWPKPHSNYTVIGTVRIYPNKLQSLEGRPNAGFEFDEAIKAACLYEAEIQRKDTNRGPKKEDWDDALLRAIQIDNQTAPRNLGYNGNGTLYAAKRGWYTGVDTYGGVTIDDPA